jgi:hypothetical protein
LPQAGEVGWKIAFWVIASLLITTGLFFQFCGSGLLTLVEIKRRKFFLMIM